MVIPIFKILFQMYLFCVLVFCLYVCMCLVPVEVTREYPLVMELRMVASHHVGTGK